MDNKALLQGGMFSGEVIADQSVPFFAPIPGGSPLTGPMSLTVTLEPGGKLIGFLGKVYVGSVNDLKTSFDWHHARAVLLPLVVLLWQVLLAALLLLLGISRRNERAARICGTLLLFSSLHGLPVLLPSQTFLTEAITLFGLVTNFWLSVLGLLFVYEFSDRKLPIPAKFLFILPTIATIAFLVLPTPLFAIFDLALVVPFSLIMVVWIVVVLIRASLVERR